jgi:hypothetical protein
VAHFSFFLAFGAVGAQALRSNLDVSLLLILAPILTVVWILPETSDISFTPHPKTSNRSTDFWGLIVYKIPIVLMAAVLLLRALAAPVPADVTYTFDPMVEPGDDADPPPAKKGVDPNESLGIILELAAGKRKFLHRCDVGFERAAGAWHCKVRLPAAESGRERLISMTGPVTRVLLNGISRANVR